MKKATFTCPVCQTRLKFKNVIRIADNHGINCPHCNAVLAPNETKTWKWCYFIGFISVVVPSKVYLEYFHDNIIVALLIGAMCGTTAIMGICVYVYKNTDFHVK
jgi:hypothetical protein